LTAVWIFGIVAKVTILPGSLLQILTAQLKTLFLSEWPRSV